MEFNLQAYETTMLNISEALRDIFGEKQTFEDMTVQDLKNLFDFNRTLLKQIENPDERL
jgi:hypothetical protein